MDFVILGIMVGAVLVGAGALLRDLGPRLRPRLARHGSGELEPEARALAWTRFCHAIGMAVTALGFLLVLATVAGFVGNVSDEFGWSIVAVASALALGGSVVAAVLISRHYRRGGFDPRARSETPAEVAWDVHAPDPATTIFADETVPLSSPDIFAFADPEPSSAATAMTRADVAEPSAAVEQVPPDEPIADSATAGFPAESASSLTANRDVTMLEPNGMIVPEIDVGEPVAATGTLKDPAVLPEPDEMPLTPESPAVFPPARATTDALPPPDRLWQPPAEGANDPQLVASPGYVPVLSSFDPPLIEFDDELPAWNAAPVERTLASAPSTPFSEVGGAFESSLLADVGTESAPAAASGQFQSRLLNELTASDGEPAAAGRDVLIRESPAADSGRADRQE